MDLTELMRRETNSHAREGIARFEENSAVIGQAKGVLWPPQGFTAREAFDEVSRRSGEQNRKARDVAAEIVPDGRRPPQRYRNRSRCLGGPLTTAGERAPSLPLLHDSCFRRPIVIGMSGTPTMDERQDSRGCVGRMRGFAAVILGSFGCASAMGRSAKHVCRNTRRNPLTENAASAAVSLKIVAADPLEAEEHLNAATRELQRLAGADKRRGILVTNTGAGCFIAELSDDVPYGLTREARNAASSGPLPSAAS